MILNNNTLKGINTSFSAIYNQAFEGAPSQFEEIATTVPSTKGENAYPWLGMTTRFREWLGDRVIQNLKTHGYTIKNKKKPKNKKGTNGILYVFVTSITHKVVIAAIKIATKA